MPAQQPERRQQRPADLEFPVHDVAHDVDLHKIPPETHKQRDQQNHRATARPVKEHLSIEVSGAEPIQNRGPNTNQDTQDQNGNATRNEGSARETPEVCHSTAQEHRKLRRLGGDVDKDGPRKKNEEHKELQQVEVAGGPDGNGEKVVAPEMDRQLSEIGKVNSAGYFLRGEAMVQVGRQPGREGDAGKQAKNQVDGVGPNHKRPVAQRESKSLDQKAG